MLPGGSLTTAVVLAAGEGTRMHSAIPKVLHPLAGRPLVEHAVRAAAGLAPEHLVVVIGHGRDAVEVHLRTVAAALGREVRAAVQAQRRGTGDAVRVALEVLPVGLSGTVLVSCGDVPLLDTGTLAGLIAEHHRAGHTVTTLTAMVEDPTGYGRVLRDRSGGVTGIVEHRDATAAQRAIHEINSGVFAFDAEVLRDALGRLGPSNSQGELYLTDVLGVVRASGLSVGAHPCPDPWLVAGVNDRVQLAAVGAECNRRLLEHWMRAGVTVVDPASVWLDVEVQLAPDVVLHPGVQLLAGTTVGPGAAIGPDSTLSGCTVGAGATVVRTHALGAVVAEGAQIGPFAYLRPGSRVGERAKVGTFVETKNAQLGPGAKVPHLSYVGDATIGAGSNIGAATVFVNYDGVTKHHTTVGAHTRTGADNMFVAPVAIGDGAYTAAGSVITQDVPPGALAVARGRQRNIEGWVARRRPGTPAAHAAAQAQQTDGAQPRQERA
ncbi:MAG: bifunctional UDP-N-acetylglucosamine diphosphorylase/glucosamine-1-phosphate N-acetyltransferase GlmU [Pseudonocardiales bacterium]|nr:bifunctional UDP-N-acetylglucosamine diphosphorylase/glucosamine-1-phosphate N-acetyltransferase GlmU [Pseudonocardiales bacterium]MBV9029865.1 bifunctional UDP-N-acetylglucosamine diphosphorylase/glucosamine-1-phosphate N-acetyltransferase GlmU [Pseudonocardiales bacterium]MBW0009658.1 bifunctional UDP-N-acetylglucosamine diphosphorylase/glucosamine-1-phosphate N-acetyltransferase GlmU [Pseudonocardiales bacterium]